MDDEEPSDEDMAMILMDVPWHVVGSVKRRLEKESYGWKFDSPQFELVAALPFGDRNAPMHKAKWVVLVLVHADFLARCLSGSPNLLRSVAHRYRFPLRCHVVLNRKKGCGEPEKDA